MPAFEAFVSLGTQWRIGVSGPSGLDYGVIPGVLRLSGIPEDGWPPLFEDLRIMEDAALTVMHEGKK